MCILDIFSGGKIHSWLGLLPRDFPAGLIGVLFSPLIHVDITYLLVNSFPFFILGAFVMLRADGINTFVVLTMMEVIIGGLMVWAFGRRDIDHNGSSGLILAYFGYLLLYGAFRKEARAAGVAILIIIFYGGIFWGILPTKDKVSWESHLVGLLIGGCYGAWEGDSSFRRDKNGATPEEKKGLTSDEAVAADDQVGAEKRMSSSFFFHSNY